MKKLLYYLAAVSVMAVLTAVSSCSTSFDQKELGSEVSLEGNTIEREYGKTIDDYSAKENLYLAASVLEKSGSFRTETVGKSVSLGISNDVSARRVVSDGAVFKESRSYSSFVSLATQTFVYKGNYLSRDKKTMSSLTKVTWSDEIKDIGKSEYLRRYGSVSSGICGYVLNDDSIISATLVSKSAGIYTFQYRLDNDIATYYIKREMAFSAGVKKLPVFEKITLTVRMDEEWKIVSVDYDGQYKVDKLGGVTCNETLCEKFYDIGGVIDFPEREIFEPHCIVDEEETDFSDFESDSDEWYEEESGDGADEPSLLDALFSDDFSLDLKAKISGVEQIESTVFDTAYISFRGGKIYAAVSDIKIFGELGDFKSATDEIIAAMPESVDLPELDFSDASELTSLLKNLEYEDSETETVIKIDLDLFGGGNITVKLERGETLAVKEIDAAFGGARILATSSDEIDYYGAVNIADTAETLAPLIKSVLCGEIDLSGRISGAKQIENSIFDSFNVAFSGGEIHAAMGGVKIYGTAEEYLDLASSVKDDINDYFGIDMSEVDFDEIKNLLSDIGDALKKIERISYREVGEDKIFVVSLGDAEISIKLGNNSEAEMIADFGEISVELVLCEEYDFSGEIPVTSLGDDYIRPLEDVLSGDVYDFALNGVWSGNTDTAISGRVRVNVKGEIYATGELTIGSVGKVLKADYLGGNIYAEYDGLKIKFSTENFVSAADDIFKFISIPNVAKLFKGFNVSKEEIEDLGIDKSEIASIIKSVSVSEGRATVAVDYSKFAVLSDDIVVSLHKNSDGKAVFDINFGLKGKKISLNALATVGGSFAKFDLDKANDYIDANGLTTLCRAVNATSEHTSYKISGSADMRGTGILALLVREVGVTVEVEVVNGRAYFVITLNRDYKLLNTTIYKDYGGITKIYYAGEENLVFVRTSYKLGGSKKSAERLECTMSDFAEKPTYYIEYALNFSQMIIDAIEDAVKENSQKDAPLGNVIKNFDYANNNFKMGVDLQPVDDNLGTMDINIGINGKTEFSSLNGVFYLLNGLFKIDFNFGLTLGVYTGADAAVKNIL